MVYRSHRGRPPRHRRRSRPRRPDDGWAIPVLGLLMIVAIMIIGHLASSQQATATQPLTTQAQIAPRASEPSQWKTEAQARPQTPSTRRPFDATPSAKTAPAQSLQGPQYTADPLMPIMPAREELPARPESAQMTGAASGPPSPSWEWASGAGSHARSSTPYSVRSFSFSVPTGMNAYPHVQCDVVFPIDASGRVLPTAADVVALFPYPTEKSGVEGFARPLATHYGFTIFTVRFPDMWPNADIDPSDRSAFYYYPESGSGQAWLSAYDVIVERLGIPRRKWFCFGRSGGGSAAHLFAEAHPDSVEAYAQEAGRIFNERPAFTGPVLSVSGEYDYVKPETDRFLASLRAHGQDPFVLTFRPNWNGRANKNPIYRHSMPNDYADVVWRWFAGLADMRTQAGVLPSRSQWPLVDGVRVPGSTYGEAVAKLPSATRALPHDEREFQHSEPRPGTVKRRVLMLSRSYMTHAEDVLLNGQYLADHGYEVLSVQALDGRPIISPRRIDDRAGPWTVEAVILDEPTESDLRTVRAWQPRPQCVVLIRASSGVLQEWGRIGWKGAQVLAFSRSPESASPGVEVRALPSKVKGPGDWHVQVMGSIVSWLDAQKDERRR